MNSTSHQAKSRPFFTMAVSAIALLTLSSGGASADEHETIDQIGTELYAGLRNHQLDSDGEDFDDVQALLVGARLKF